LSFAAGFERVVIAVPADFALAYQDRDEAVGRNLMEFIRKGDTLEAWREIVTIESFELLKWGGGSPDEVLEATRVAREQACPGATTWNVIARDAHRVVYEWNTDTPCMGHPPQWEIAAVVFGKLDRFRLAYASKTGPPSARERDLWTQIFELALVTRDGALVWDHPRSDPPAFIRDVLASGMWRVGLQGVGGLPLQPGSEIAYGEVSHTASELQFVRAGDPKPVPRYQELDRQSITPGFSLDSLVSKYETAQRKNCAKGFSAEHIVSEPARVVTTYTFKGCKKGMDEQRVTVLLKGTEDVFIWSDTVRPGWEDASQRAQMIDAGLGITLVNFGGDGLPLPMPAPDPVVP